MPRETAGRRSEWVHGRAVPACFTGDRSAAVHDWPRLRPAAGRRQPPLHPSAAHGLDPPRLGVRAAHPSLRTDARRSLPQAPPDEHRPRPAGRPRSPPVPDPQHRDPRRTDQPGHFRRSSPGAAVRTRPGLTGSPSPRGVAPLGPVGVFQAALTLSFSAARRPAAVSVACHPGACPPWCPGAGLRVTPAIVAASLSQVVLGLGKCSRARHDWPRPPRCASKVSHDGAARVVLGPRRPPGPLTAARNAAGQYPEMKIETFQARSGCARRGTAPRSLLPFMSASSPPASCGQTRSAATGGACAAVHDLLDAASRACWRSLGQSNSANTAPDRGRPSAHRCHGPGRSLPAPSRL